MDKVEHYRQVFTAFKELCAMGNQSCSFREYCLKHGVDYGQMRKVLKGEFQNVSTLSGYRRGSSLKFLCSQVYEEFKHLCSCGIQPGSFTEYCVSFGITWKQMKGYLCRNRLPVVGLPGYTSPLRGRLSGSRCKEIPFEDVIFEEAGFLSADRYNVITVRVDGHVEVSFPGNTDISVVAGFIRKMGKEAGHVGS